MIDVGLDATTWDLPEFSQIISTPRDMAMQRCKIRLGFWRGEWLLDQRVGLPFADWLQQKEPDTSVIASFLTDEILQVPEVKRVINLDVTFDRTEEKLLVAARVLVKDGDEFELEFALFDIFGDPTGLSQ